MSTFTNTPEAREQFRKLIISSVRQTRDGLPVAQVRQVAEVLDVKYLESKETRTEEQALSQVLVRVGEQQHTWYVLEIAYGDFDDADNWCHVFEAQHPARELYLDYLDPEGRSAKIAKVEQSVFEVIMPGKDTRHVVGVLHQGKLCKVVGVGLGSQYREYFAPYFNTEKLTPAQMDEIRQMERLHRAESDAQLWNRPDLLAGAFVLGDNGNGRFVKSDQHASFCRHHCWETGLTYFELRTRVPAEVFAALRKDAELFYHDHQIEEEGDWKAWCTMDNMRAGEVLARFGWEIAVAD
jgi:hypothetical protein